jgi:iron complex outermembrane receptor protein
MAVYRAAVGSVLVLLAGSITAQGQETPRPPADPVSGTEKEAVVLPRFTVSTANPTKYGALDAVSSTRVRDDLLDTPASIAVATNAMLEDTAISRLYDALRYLPGISDANSPNISDRVTLRGFASNSGNYVDSAPFITNANMDSVLIERVEVVNGPDAILSSNGLAGGTINVITKSPAYTASNRLTLGVGRFNANRADLDMTGAVRPDSAFAYRLVASYQDANKVSRGGNLRQTVLFPSLTYRRRNMEVTYKVFFIDWRATYEGALPIDPSGSSQNTAMLLPGLDQRDYISPPNLFRRSRSMTNSLLFTANLGSHVVSRIFGEYIDSQYVDSTALIGSLPTGGATNPLTGLFTPGVAYGPAPAYAPLSTTPAQPNWRSVPMSGSHVYQPRYSAFLQNDTIMTFDLPGELKSTTIAGWQTTEAKVRTVVDALSFAPVDIFAPAYGGPTRTPTSNATTDSRSLSGYILERLSAFHDRVIVDGGAQATANRNRSTNELNHSVAFNRGNTTTFFAGGLIKVTPTFSAYASFSENGQPVSSGLPLAPIVNQLGKQNEAGVKAEFFNRRLRFTAAYYDITLTNFTVSNFAHNIDPSLPNNLLLDLKSRGEEFAVVGQLTRNLDVIGNYSYNHIRDPFGRRTRGTADNTGGVAFNYDWHEGALKGASASLGVVYTGSRAGDQQTGFTAAGVPIQPTFYLAPRTLVNIGASYVWSRYKVQANIENLFDKEYYFGSSRTTIYPGMPLNATLRFSASF